MAKICSSKGVKTNLTANSNKTENSVFKCRFKIDCTSDNPFTDFFPPENSLKERKKKKPQKFALSNTQTKFSLEKAKLQCHFEERRRNAELRRKKIIEKLERIYNLNIEDLNENIRDEIILKLESWEKEKRDREKRKREQTFKMMTRLIDEQKYKRRGLNFRPTRRCKTMKAHSQSVEICESEDEEDQKVDEEQESMMGEEKQADNESQKTLKSVKDKENKKSSVVDAKSKEIKKTTQEDFETNKLPFCKQETIRDDSILGETDSLIIEPPKTRKSWLIERCLESTPKRIVFENYKKYVVYLEDLRITNIGLETIHCRYLGIALRTKSEKRFPIGVAVRDSMKLRPGLSTSTKIRLYSKEDTEELECSIVYETRRQCKPNQPAWFLVPVLCLPARAIINVKPTKIIFPTLSWCTATAPEGKKLLTKIISIENTGGKACSCKISSESLKKTKSESFENVDEEEEEEEEVIEEEEEEEKEDLKTIPSTKSKSLIKSVGESKSVSHSEELMGENNFPSFEEALETALLIVKELIDNVLAIFRFSEKYFIEIAPFSTKKIEVRFIPEYRGFHHDVYFIQFEDCSNVDEVRIELMGTIKKIPLRVEPQVIDMKICVANSGVYSATFKIFNDSKGPYSVTLKIPSSLRRHANVLPVTTTIQSFNSLEFSVKIFPRISLNKDAQKYYKNGILEFPIFIHPANNEKCKLDFIKIYVFASITNYALELKPNEFDFGEVTTVETVRSNFTLTNHSLALQEFAFLNLPLGVRVEPNMGFGRILPKETIKLHLLYSPGSDLTGCEKNKEHSFVVKVTSLAEYGGFGEKLEVEEEESTTSLESLWDEEYGYQYENSEEISIHPKETEERGEDSEDVEDDACSKYSSIEGEELNKIRYKKEIKIREFIKKDRDRTSDHSFFARMNLQSKDYDRPRSVLCKNTFQESNSVASETGEQDDFSEDCLLTFDPKRNFIQCKAVIIEPRYRLSESVIQLPPTPFSSVSMYRFRLNSAVEADNANCTCGLRSTANKLNGCRDQIEGCFEFHSDCHQVKLEPQSGFFKNGEGLPVFIIWRPEFPAEYLRHESRIQKVKKSMREKKSIKEPTELKANLSSKSRRMTNQSLTQTSNRRSIDTHEGDAEENIVDLSTIDLEKFDLFLGEKSLQELTYPSHSKIKIRCVIKTLKCSSQDQQIEVHNMVLVCPVIKPNFIYLGASQEINFGKVYVGTRPKVVLQVQNISFERISPEISFLNPVGSFYCPIWFKKPEIDPEHVWRQPLTYAPEATLGVEKEFFEIRCGPTNLSLAVSGEGITPQYKITPNFACCLVETKPGSKEEIKIDIENQNSIKLKLNIVTEFVKEGLEEQEEEEVEEEEEEGKKAVEEVKIKNRRKSQKEDLNDKRKKNTESERKILSFWDEVPEEILTDIENFEEVESETEVFSVVGTDGFQEVSVAPFAKFSIKIRYTPPTITSDSVTSKKYAAKYKIMLEGRHFLKEILIIGAVTKSNFN